MMGCIEGAGKQFPLLDVRHDFQSDSRKNNLHVRGQAVLHGNISTAEWHEPVSISTASRTSSADRRSWSQSPCASDPSASNAVVKVRDNVRKLAFRESLGMQTVEK